MIQYTGVFTSNPFASLTTIEESHQEDIYGKPSCVGNIIDVTHETVEASTKKDAIPVILEPIEDLGHYIAGATASEDDEVVKSFTNDPMMETPSHK